MKMVAQVVQHLTPGGIETMALDLVAFCEDHEKTVIISLEGNRQSAIANWSRLEAVADELIFLDKKPGLNPGLIFRLRKLFKQLDVDVVHTHHIGPLLYAGIAARFAGIECLIHTEHDAWHLSDLRRRKLQSSIIRLVRPSVVADAETVAAKMRHYLGLEKIRVIRNGIDTQRFTPGDQEAARRQLGLPQGVQLVGCSGRLEAVKGHKNVINALVQMPPGIHLALAGAGSLENELQCLVQRQGLCERVHFLGRVDDMPCFYRALDIFCLPSLNEGLPLSPLEAQACGIPAVVTDVGGSSEALCPHSGELVPAGNADAMATTLIKMLVPQNRQHQSAPRKFVQKQGDVRLMAQAYANMRCLGVGNV